MATDTELDDGGKVLALDREVRSLRRRLAQREQMLAGLNRRLLQLERGDNGLSGMQRAELRGPAAGHPSLQAELASVKDANRALQEELYWLRHSKVFRWSRPARKVYHVLRRR
jgi:chromosome segregation ATPase